MKKIEFLITNKVVIESPDDCSINELKQIASFLCSDSDENWDLSDITYDVNEVATLLYGVSGDGTVHYSRHSDYLEACCGANAYNIELLKSYHKHEVTCKNCMRTKLYKGKSNDK